MSTPATGAPVSPAADLREQARLEAVRSLRILDDPLGPRIGELVRLAAEVCDVPNAMLNIFDEALVHPLASVGLETYPHPQEDSLCRFVVRSGVEIIAPDARLEPRFADNAFVRPPDGLVRFYASVPLTTENGLTVGTLCTYDLVPHDLSATQVSLLRTLAEQVTGILELRLALTRSVRAAEQLAELADQADEVLQTSMDAYYSMHPDGIVRAWNRAAEELYGYSGAEAIGQRLEHLIVPERFQDLFRARRPQNLTQARGQMRVVVRCKDGSERTVDLMIWPSQAQPGWHAFARDVSATVAAQQEQAAVEERWRVAFEHAPVGMAVSDLSTPGRALVVTANQKYCDMMGYSLELIRQLGVIGVTYPDDLGRDLAAATKLLDGSLEIYRTDKRYVHADGHIVWGRLTASIARTDTAIYMISQVEDITEARAAERARRQAESLLTIAFEHAPHGTAIIGVRGAERGRLLRVNPALVAMTRQENLVGRLFADLLGQDAVDVLTDFELVADGEQDLFERGCRLRAGHGHIYVQASITLSRDGEGRPEHALAQLRDVTQQHAHEEWLTRHATTDSLTGLANRLAMRERLVAEIDGLRDGAGALAVLMLDLDHFKQVNDTLGHEAGDELLRRVAEALGRALPESALAARLGGDEFVVIAPRLEPAAVRQLVARIVTAVDRVGAELTGSLERPVTGSVGHATTEDPSAAPEDLIREADQAMYRAKRRRRRE